MSNDPLVRLTNTDTFILDLDGTVYLSDKLIDGAREFIDFLRESGRRFVFITNNSSRTATEYVEKLTRLGIDCSLDNIYTSLDATLAWMKKQDGRRVYPLGVPSFVKQVETEGFTVTDESPDWVLLGFDMTIDYEKIRAASRLILAGSRFVATHPDFTCPTAGGPIPDTGAFIKMFEAATGVSPVICGKPYPAMVEGALGKLGSNPERAAVIGDRLYTDMAMAKAAGMLSVLVLSGETTVRDVEDAPQDKRGDLVFDNLAAVLRALENRQA